MDDAAFGVRHVGSPAEIRQKLACLTGLLYRKPVDDSLTIDERFCGPPGTANGGYLAGRLAALTAGTVEVTLKRATAVGRPLRVERRGGSVDLYDGEALTAQARTVSFDVELPRAVSVPEAQAGTQAFPRFENHPLPGCFVCGVNRRAGDGLRIFPGPVPGREEIWAAPWIPDMSLADDSGNVRPEFLWAALDCAGAFAVNEPPRGLALLGRIAARVAGKAAAGETLVVAAWAIARDGRKLQPGTAIYTAKGELVACARALWILT
jgi:hypothetical protein